MKLAISQPQLLRHLQIVERAVNDRSALPILANILLETKDNTLTLTATDLDVGIRCRLPLSDSSDGGAAALPARRLSGLVRELPDEPVMIEAKKNHSTTLSCGRSHFRLQGLPPEDFPLFPNPTGGRAVRILQEHLKALILRTAFAMSMEETRFVLNGALWRVEGSTLTVVATDGRRLAVAQAEVVGEAPEPLQAVIPAKTIRELGRLLQGDGAGLATITVLKDQQLAITFEDVTVMTRLIDGQFPSYEAVLPAPSTTSVVCSRSLLMGAIKRASLMTTAASQAIVFEVSEGRLVVFKESPELGSAREELPATYRGEAMTIAFNPEFWLDVLKALETDVVAIELTAPDKPAVVRQPDFLYVVLPMKLA
jgi:DNA polymerase-3 subunit beta